MKLLVFSLFVSQIAAFAIIRQVPTPTPSLPILVCHQPQQSASTTRLGPLFMGRAAAVRAATKSKTDGKKAKVNGIFGKKIIMAVKQGGSPDMSANGVLAAVVKSAKLNNVPAEVSQCASNACVELETIFFTFCSKVNNNVSSQARLIRSFIFGDPLIEYRSGH
jgi:hypothetical protein